MMPQYDLMLDIETLSTAPNAAIIQIGMAPFSFETGRLGTAKLKIGVRPDHAAKIDIPTIRWWMSQSDEARSSAFDALDQTDELTACRHIEALCNSYEGAKIWAMPPTFDVVIVEAMFRRQGMNIPWAHYNTRDLRTLADLAGATKEDRITPSVAHDALADAEAQALSAIKFYNMLKAKAA